jgi:hypothetical protein
MPAQCQSREFVQSFAALALFAQGAAKVERFAQALLFPENLQEALLTDVHVPQHLGVVLVHADPVVAALELFTGKVFQGLGSTSFRGVVDTDAVSRGVLDDCRLQLHLAILLIDSVGTVRRVAAPRQADVEASHQLGNLLQLGDVGLLGQSFLDGVANDQSFVLTLCGCFNQLNTSRYDLFHFLKQKLGSF